ncbi:MAG: GTP 3',8-cyclase MoaA [Cyclobacteriaceae bacterium]
MKKKQIIDNFGREHTYLRISLTERCNLRCFYCMPENGIELMPKSHIMSFEEIMKLAETFVSLGVDTIRLTGGEPLVRKHVEQLFRDLSKLPVKLKITTNGILLDRFYDLFEEIGLKDINISLDTLDKTKSVFITKRDYYDRILANINEGLTRGFNIKLNIVLIKGVNDVEIPDFIDMTRDQNLAVKFIEFMPFHENKWDVSKCVSQQEILDIVGAKYPLKKLKDPVHSTSHNYQVDGFKGKFGIISTVTNPFCSGCNRLRITANGQMKNCLFARSETDLLTPLRAGKDVTDLILTSIKTKKFSRDGMDTFTSDQYEQNRAMISIGG